MQQMQIHTDLTEKGNSIARMQNTIITLIRFGGPVD